MKACDRFDPGPERAGDSVLICAGAKDVALPDGTQDLAVSELAAASAGVAGDTTSDIVTHGGSDGCRI
jgi:hypothetical protein